MHVKSNFFQVLGVGDQIAARDVLMEVDIVAGRSRFLDIVSDSVVADSVVADAIVADLDHSDGNHSNRVLTGVIANPVKSKTNQDRSLDMCVRNSPSHGYGVRSW